MNRMPDEKGMPKQGRVQSAEGLAEDRALRNLTHELRTALSVIIGFSESMRSELYGPLSNERYKDYAEGIFHSGRHLIDLINGYADFVALNEGSLELQDEPVNLEFSIGKVVRNFTPRAAKNQVSVSTNKLEGLPVLSVDKARFKQVLSAILFHAIQRVPNGGDIDLRAKVKDGDVTIKVRHSGAAMTAAEIAEAMREPISTAPNWLYRREESAGLGLFMAHQMTEALGGSFGIASKPGKGTMVKLRFPKERVVG